MEFGLTIETQSGAARAGWLTTRRGRVATPAFMPVGTAATVKAMTPQMLRQTGAGIVLANTYHLMLRPGSERLSRLGGIHRFMNWPGAVLTDSGGYQVMSLAKLRHIDDDGVTFASHLDGSRHRLTPERCMELQHQIGSDIVMQLDECSALPAPQPEIERAVARSLAWAQRCQAALAPEPGRALFGIVQGGTDRGLRARSARGLVGLGFAGYAVGGLAVGESQAEMFEVLDDTVPHLPPERPRYLMGVGKPGDIVGAVARGIDMFDCVLPTRSGRNGQAFTSRGTLNLKNARHAEDSRPLDPTIDCPASHDYSRAYLHHLVKSGEILGAMLLTWHNLAYYQTLMRSLRMAVVEGRLAEFAAGFQTNQSEEER